MKELSKLSTISHADNLRSIPGITAAGGETASGIYVKGLSSSGQWVFNLLQYDGMLFISSGRPILPIGVFHTVTLNI